ncbi:hypothetical protein E2C01_023225 [Portunus trituberculatus]|uniref:Uncharacterized protein n=1 Tax=Portunus trituberculatus TaxID=210409 RepID=A0A5B7E7F7_PORTR|nr:hypothetical protein [Portunus trituberculatus]
MVVPQIKEGGNAGRGSHGRGAGTSELVMLGSGELFVGNIAIPVLIFVVEDLLSDLVWVLPILQLLSWQLSLDVV